MFLDSEASKIIKERSGVFADNDFLGLIYENKELLKDTISLLSGKKLYLSPFTEFEFLRDVFAPEVRVLKEEFVASPVFGHIREEAHLRVFSKLLKNALLLSKIFAHQNTNRGGNKKISFVDLLLASLLMYLKGKAVLITGNKKDFPSCVFDIAAVLNFEASDGNVRAISVVEFNQEKFDQCHESLKKLEKPSDETSPKDILEKVVTLEN